MDKRKITSYLLYAIGEIILVVIGILIAVTINNWNEQKKLRARESAFLTNLQVDLKSDSLRLAELQEDLTVAFSYKVLFLKHAEGRPVDKDSLTDHFYQQYQILTDFVPNTATVDELKNTGLTLISDPSLRRQIVTLYNEYGNLKLKLTLGQEKAQTLISYISDKVLNIDELSHEEILMLAKDPYFVNQVRMNYVFTQKTAVETAYLQCSETLSMIIKEIDRATAP